MTSEFNRLTIDRKYEPFEPIMILVCASKHMTEASMTKHARETSREGLLNSLNPLVLANRKSEAILSRAEKERDRRCNLNLNKGNTVLTVPSKQVVGRDICM